MMTLMSGATTFSTTTLVRMILYLVIATLSKKTVALNNEFKNEVIKSGMSQILYRYGIL